MSGSGDNLVLEHLRHIRAAVDEIRLDKRELKSRVGILEQQYASVSNRIERRVGLADA